MRRERGEDGQALPGLLVVTLAAFAIALGLFSLARGEEQSARSDTAADAAALAAVKQWHIEALRALQSTAMTPAIGATLTALNVYQPASGYPSAEEFARANGASMVPGGYRWIPDLSPVTWTVEVTVEQRDDLPNDADEARSTSRARLEATGGLCNAGASVGLVLRDQSCADPARAAQVCTPPTPATPNPLYVECPSAAEIAAGYKTERTFVD
jgi:hypothetical protein